MKAVKKFIHYFTHRNVFKCPVCNVQLRLNKQEIKKAELYSGPYCPKCGNRLRGRLSDEF